MKTRFHSGDSLPLKQESEMHNVVIIVKYVFKDSNKY